MKQPRRLRTDQAANETGREVPFLRDVVVAAVVLEEGHGLGLEEGHAPLRARGDGGDVAFVGGLQERWQHGLEQPGHRLGGCSDGVGCGLPKCARAGGRSLGLGLVQ